METNTTADSYFSDIYESSYEPTYAGFWIRVVAVFIDGFVLMIPNFIIQAVFIGTTAFNQEQLGQNPFVFFASLATYATASMMLQILYKSIMESSSWQATLGKRALNLKVTDEQGQRITFMRAFGRSFASLLSSMIMCIGHLMVAFSSKKQGLHDKIANTLVVKTR